MTTIVEAKKYMLEMNIRSQRNIIQNLSTVPTIDNLLKLREATKELEWLINQTIDFVIEFP